MLRHGRSSALYVALKEAPEVIYTNETKDKLCKVLLVHLAADRVPIAMNGVRSCGYLLQYLMSTQQPLPTQILGPFVRVSILVLTARISPPPSSPPSLYYHRM